ncbi:STAS domain-containing protein [Pseudoduganella sp. HUAS MS19]
MGLFSIFKKGKVEESVVETDDADAARLAANSELERQRAQQSDLQREIARATAMKIDAIEAAMAADIFNEPEPAWARKPRTLQPAAAAAANDGATLPLLDQYTTELLGDEDMPLEAAAAESAPIVEEIAILYSNGQAEVAEQMLLGSLPDSAQDRTVWWMLFDLYQVLGRQESFENVSIDYASQYETSPPSWVPPASADSKAPEVTRGYSGVTPTLGLAGMLNASVAPQLERLDSMDQKQPLRLDFSRVNGVDPEGCALLLEALKKVQAADRELIVVGAAELAEQVRNILTIGNRDVGEAPWLLYLELLRLLNQEKEFEEASMDYCVTFEVSPPPFVAPKKVANAPRQATAAASDRFMLPAVIEGDIGTLLGAIDAYASENQVVVFDCGRLARMEFGAASALQAKVAELASGEHRVEFRDLNHLVAALMRLLGYADIARLFPHKY